MDRSDLLKELLRLSKVGFGYDISDTDGDVLRQAANELQDLWAFSNLARLNARSILGQREVSTPVKGPK